MRRSVNDEPEFCVADIVNANGAAHHGDATRRVFDNQWRHKVGKRRNLEFFKNFKIKNLIFLNEFVCFW